MDINEIIPYITSSNDIPVSRASVPSEFGPELAKILPPAIKVDHTDNERIILNNKQIKYLHRYFGTNGHLHTQAIKEQDAKIIIAQTKFIDQGKKWLAEVMLDFQMRMGEVISFYDLDQDEKKFGDKGQHVSGYYLSTFLGISEKDQRGLDLYGGVPAWKIEAQTICDLKNWIATI